ncbi:MAG: aldehyde dehydrogenase family protein, partial [Candidatus Puniceispirillum sp.]|nr:aldehyde dehydrogenase family protein [Candidatus Puniceispirillum sp.]
MQLNNPALLKSEAYINGAWVSAADGKTFAVRNPASGEVIANVADLGAAETTAAIDASVPAQKAWAARTAKDRATVMRKWYDLAMANADDLAVILTAEMG